MNYRRYYTVWGGLLAFFVILGASSATVMASQVILNYTKEMQQMTKWCWVASAKNSAKYTINTSITQSEAVDHIKGSIGNYGGTLTDIELAAEYISMYLMSYQNCGISTTSGVKSFSYLTDKVDQGLVTILVAGKYVNGVRESGHAVTMHGYFSYGSYASMIWYYDPWPDDNTDYECTYSSFVNGSFNGRMYDGTVFCTYVFDI